MLAQATTPEMQEPYVMHSDISLANSKGEFHGGMKFSSI